MSTSKLVLSAAALNDNAAMVRDLHYIKIASRVFALDLPAPEPSRLERAFDTKWTLLRGDWSNAYEFYWMVDGIAESPGPENDFLKCAKDLRYLGLDAPAQVIEDYFALGRATPLEEAKPDEENSHRAQSEVLQAKLDAFQSDWEATVEGLTEEAVDQILVSGFNLDLVSDEAFDAFWVNTITASPVFSDPATVRKRLETEKAAPVHYEEVETALAAKGFEVQFPFWGREYEEKDGRLTVWAKRGHVYVQTSKGPIRTMDHTDPVKFGMDYPVQVETIDGEHLFEITKEDTIAPKKRRWFWQ